MVIDICLSLWSIWLVTQGPQDVECQRADIINYYPGLGANVPTLLMIVLDPEYSTGLKSLVIEGC